jgi:hypothetical protein
MRYSWNTYGFEQGVKTFAFASQHVQMAAIVALEHWRGHCNIVE